MKAPFPWFGGKRQVADAVWERLGDPSVYCEPFAGSLAVLLNRPGWHRGTVETVNDVDGFVCNAWRAILHDPDLTAHYADWPVNENDLHARHAWLVARRADLTRRLEGDPDYCDAKIAGWWLWGIACWIGGGWCSGRGPWAVEEDEDGTPQLVRSSSGGQGVNRQLVHLGNTGEGVNRNRVHLNAGQGVNRTRVHLGDAGQGVNRRLVHLNAVRGVNRTTVELTDWFHELTQRIRNIRVCCGDWARVVTPSAMCPSVGGPRAVFLDPPYGEAAERDGDLYSHDSTVLADQVRAWCLTAPDDWRIALCGYQGEHERLEDAGWTVHTWTTQGGMQKDKHLGGNRERERIWFSPACAQPDQLTLLAKEAG